MVTRSSKNTGFTLIEILFVIFLISIVAGFAVPRFNALTTINLRSATRHMASLIRYSFNTAVLSGKRHRLVLNFDERAYWIEVYEEIVEEEKDEDDGTELSEGVSLDDQDDEPRVRGEFVKTEGFLVKAKKLPDGVDYLKYKPLEESEVRAGEAFLYFYPEGESSGGELVLKSGEENFMTLVINALTGEVRIYNELLDEEQAS